MRNVYKFSIAKLVGKRSLRRSRIRWEDNIEMDLKEIESEAVSWIRVTQEGTQWLDPMNTIRNVWVPYKAGNFLTR
jgi:hypothetical protein